MIQIKEFTKGINKRIIEYHLTCKVMINEKEYDVSAIINEDDDDFNAIKFDWNYGYENISEEDLYILESEMLDKFYN